MAVPVGAVGIVWFCGVCHVWFWAAGHCCGADWAA